MGRRRAVILGCALLVALAALIVPVAGQNCRANGFNNGSIGHDAPTACTPVRFWVTTTDPDYCGDDPEAFYDDIHVKWDWGDGSSQETFLSENYGDNVSSPRTTIIGNVYHTYMTCGTFTVRAWVWDKGNFAQDISPDSPRLLASVEVRVTSDCDPPTISILKPAVDNEYVGGMGDQDDMEPYDCHLVLVKATVSDSSGICWVKFYVDNVYKGDMTLVNDEYWFYIWDVSGTQQGTHRLKVEACDNSACHNVGFVERDVYVKPQLDTDWIEWQNDHNLWLRDPLISPYGDRAITPPHWTPTDTQPFAYTISATMSCNVHVFSPDDSVTGAVHVRYVVVNTWSDEHVEGPTIAGGTGAMPFAVSHDLTARPKVRRPYSLSQEFAFYVRRSDQSDWACAGSRTVYHPWVYLTFRDPVGPWGPSAKPRACWSEVLRDACIWMPLGGYDSSQELDAMKLLAERAYWDGGKNYDGGQSHYVPWPEQPPHASMRFQLWGFMSDQNNQADCQDMALWWQKLSHSIGLGTDSRFINGPFWYQMLDPVGSPDWRGGGPYDAWNFHMIGWAANVFDPCIRLDQTTPRVPVDEDINNPYRTDLYRMGTWDPLEPFRLGGTDNRYNLPSEVD